MSLRRAAVALLALASIGCHGEQPTPRAPGMNVLLVTVDTLRADALGVYGNERATTPNLDALARAGVRCDFAHAHAVVTLPSHTSILTGLYPFQHGVRDNAGFRLREDVPTLATLLAGQGYATAAFVGGFPLDRRFGLARGFEVYDDRLAESPGGGVDFAMSERRADEVVRLALAWMRSVHGRPWFLWVHVYDPHAPYAPPPPYAARYATEPYLGEVSWVDEALAPLLAAAVATPSFVVVTADHGEALGDHGELTHGLFAYEATLRVPLVLWSQKTLAPGFYSGLARHVDIVPTVLDALGVTAPAASLPGRSLLGPVAGHEGAPVTSYFEALSPYFGRGWAPLRGLLSGREKLVDLPVAEMYDLARDPGEKANLAGELGVRLEQGRRDLAALAGSAVDAAPAAEPPEVREKLRGLGYLSGATTGPGQGRVYTVADDPKRLLPLDQAVQAAIDAWERGDRARAEATLRGVLAERPDLTVARLDLAHVLHESGRLAEAVAELRLAAASRPSAEAVTLLALYLGEAGEAAEAVRLLTPWAEAGQSDVDLLNAYGVALGESGEAARAKDVFGRVLTLDATNATALQNQGTLALMVEKLDEARALFDQAVSIDPRLARAWNGLGVVAIKQGDKATAVASFKRAVAVDPRDWDTVYNLGLLLVEQGQPAAARPYLESFVSGAPREAYGRDVDEVKAILQSLGR